MKLLKYSLEAPGLAKEAPLAVPSCPDLSDVVFNMGVQGNGGHSVRRL